MKKKGEIPYQKMEELLGEAETSSQTVIEGEMKNPG